MSDGFIGLLPVIQGEEGRITECKHCLPIVALVETPSTGWTGLQNLTLHL